MAAKRSASEQKCSVLCEKTMLKFQMCWQEEQNTLYNPKRSVHPSSSKTWYSRLVSSYRLNAHFLYSITIYICNITILNMFPAVPCSSSWGQIVLLQPLVSSLFVNGRTVCRLRADCSPLSTDILYGCLQRVTIPEAVIIQFFLLRMSKVLLETCWGL